MCLKRGWCGEGHTRRKGNRGTLGAVRAGTRVVLRAPTEEAIANLASWKKCDSLQQSAIDDAVRIASQRGTLRIATRHATSLQTPESPMGQLSVLLGRALALLGTAPTDNQFTVFDKLNRLIKRDLHIRRGKDSR